MTESHGRRCPLCESTGTIRWAARDWSRGTSDERFRYRRCVTCRSTYLEDVPDDLSRHYDAGYHRSPDSETAMRQLAEPERFKIELVRRFARSGRLLEIGPSFGAFAHLARSAGFEVEAVEPDPACRDALRTLVGVVATERLEEIEDRKGEAYDVIALWQVLEHLPEAGRALTRIRRLLRPGGLVVIATPNPDAPQARVFGPRWAHVDAPRHLVLIPPATLVRHADGIGLRVELLTTSDAGSRGWNSFGWATSLENLARGGRLGPVLRFAGRAIAFLLRPLERTGLRAASYTAVLRRID